MTSSRRELVIYRDLEIAALTCPLSHTIMARKAAALGLAAVLGTAAAGSVSLTDSNFDTEVFDSGKNAFIKFQAPWCVSTPDLLERRLCCSASGARCIFRRGEQPHRTNADASLGR